MSKALLALAFITAVIALILLLRINVTYTQVPQLQIAPNGTLITIP